eukprot:scaffold201_cov405-Prasinococcus_capsulatus_cf.AAC.39
MGAQLPGPPSEKKQRALQTLSQLCCSSKQKERSSCSVRCRLRQSRSEFYVFDVAEFKAVMSVLPTQYTIGTSARSVHSLGTWHLGEALARRGCGEDP